jgi:aspartate/methionine/tyrosine aminotransferase
MRVEREKLGDWFILGRQTKWKYSLTSVGRPAAKLKDLGITLDPSMSLDWGGYYFGPPLLKQRIIETQHYALSEQNLFVANGTYEANYLAVLATVEKGDEVIVEAPAWTQVGLLCNSIGAQVKVLRLREENQWKPDPDELRRLLSPKVKLVFINHPNNPTGSVLTNSEMEAICTVVEKYGAYLLSDEIYRGLEWDGPLSPSVVNLYERGIVSSSLTKTLGLCGLRLGWIGSRNQEFIDRAFALHRYGVMVNDVMGELLGTAALDPATYARLLQEGKELGKCNRQIIQDWMASNSLFEWVLPGGGFMSFPRFNMPVSSWDLCIRLLAEPYATYMVPGVCYGDEFDSNVRLGFGSLTPSVQAGLAQLDIFAKQVTASKQD